jgi:hypothetical protein
MIMGPLLLEFGLHPMISAATSGMMVLVSSSIAAFSFGFDGLLNLQYALVRHRLGQGSAVQCSVMYPALAYPAPGPSALCAWTKHAQSPDPMCWRCAAKPHACAMRVPSCLPRAPCGSCGMRAEQQQRPPSAPATCPAARVPAERCNCSRARQIFGIGCLLASLVGVLLVASAVKRSGKASIVVFLLAFVRPAEPSLALALQSANSCECPRNAPFVSSMLYAVDHGSLSLGRFKCTNASLLFSPCTNPSMSRQVEPSPAAAGHRRWRGAHSGFWRPRRRRGAALLLPLAHVGKAATQCML